MIQNRPLFPGPRSLGDRSHRGQMKKMENGLSKQTTLRRQAQLRQPYFSIVGIEFHELPSSALGYPMQNACCAKSAKPWGRWLSNDCDLIFGIASHVNSEVMNMNTYFNL